MAKARGKKSVELDKLRQRLAQSKSVVVTSETGVSVRAIEKLRGDLRQQNAEYQVIKKTLWRIVAKEHDWQMPAGDAGTMGLAFSYGDEVAAAKTLHGFGKENQGLKLVGGILEQRFIDQSQVMVLAQLPGRQELLAQTVRVMQGPISGFVNVLSGTMRNLLTVLQAVGEKKQ